MNKFIILGDMHIGARGASTIVMEHQLRYFEEEMFPYMHKHDIKIILQLGDVFDTRKFTNHLVLHEWKKRFFDYMENNGIKFVTLLGNHDVFYKNTLEVNSVELFLGNYSNIHIVKEPKELNFNGVKFFLVPWICESNIEQLIDMKETTNALFCAGHFEFIGFEMHPGHVMTEGIDPSAFEKFDKVFSGHYHTRSKKDNIEYVGIPYELTWIDYADPKGFTVFDTNTNKTEFIRNENSLFVKIHYDDLDQDENYWKTISCIGARNAFVKLVVAHKTNPNQFNKIVDLIEAIQPIELKIMDVVEDFTDVEIDDNIEAEDTPALIDSFVEKVDTDLDKDKIVSILKNLYVEAINVPL